MNYWKKGLMVVMVLGLIVVSGLASKAIYFPGTAKAAEESKERTLEVGGQGMVMVKPDIALISFGVMTRNKVPKVAQGENAQLMDKVIKRLATLNIQSADIKTTGYYMNPDIIYDNSTRKEKIVSYYVNHQVQVTVRDVTKAGDVLDGVVQEGVNNANGIQFGVSAEKRVEYYHQALAAALSSAKDKAKVMAKAMEINIDKPKRIVENGGEATVLYQEGLYDKRKVINQMAQESVAPPISSGELEIRAAVGVTYIY
jgi:uncharacterized protein YggE